MLRTLVYLAVAVGVVLALGGFTANALNASRATIVGLAGQIIGLALVLLVIVLALAALLQGTQVTPDRMVLASVPLATGLSLYGLDSGPWLAVALVIAAVAYARTGTLPGSGA